MSALEAEPIAEQRSEPLGGVAWAQVAVLCVAQPKGLAEAPQERSLQVRRVDQQTPSWLRDAGQLDDEGLLVDHVLEHVHDDDAVELRLGEG